MSKLYTKKTLLRSITKFNNPKRVIYFLTGKNGNISRKSAKKYIVKNWKPLLDRYSDSFGNTMRFSFSNKKMRGFRKKDFYKTGPSRGMHKRLLDYNQILHIDGKIKDMLLSKKDGIGKYLYIGKSRKLRQGAKFNKEIKFYKNLRKFYKDKGLLDDKFHGSPSVKRVPSIKKIQISKEIKWFLKNHPQAAKFAQRHKGTEKYKKFMELLKKKTRS